MTGPERPHETDACQAQAAEELCERAYDAHMNGDYRTALNLYQRAIELYPTAEAYTFLGWTQSNMGDFEHAIASCHKAIELDPGFGNPYNDIGASLIELGRYEEAIPWLLRATQAPRYECQQYPWFNLGRIYERLGDLARAKACYVRSLAACPQYCLARRALTRLISANN